MVNQALRIDTGNESPPPRIAAAFLVNFDHRKGYAEPDLEVNNDAD